MGVGGGVGLRWYLPPCICKVYKLTSPYILATLFSPLRTNLCFPQVLLKNWGLSSFYRGCEVREGRGLKELNPPLNSRLCVYVHIFWRWEPLSAETGSVSLSCSLGTVIAAVWLCVKTAVVAAPHCFLTLRFGVVGPTALPSLHRGNYKHTETWNLSLQRRKSLKTSRDCESSWNYVLIQKHWFDLVAWTIKFFAVELPNYRYLWKLTWYQRYLRNAVVHESDRK